MRHRLFRSIPWGEYIKDKKRYNTHRLTQEQMEERGFVYAPLAPLIEAAYRQVQKMKQACRLARVEGFTLNNDMFIPTDLDTVLKIMIARLKADRNPAYIYEDWELEDDNTINLNATQIIAIDDKMELFQAAMSKCLGNRIRSIKAIVLAEGTVAEIEAITWE